MYPVHVLPPGKRFMLYVNDGRNSRVVLWFKCGDNGDLVTKPMAVMGEVIEGHGKIEDGQFVISGQGQPVPLTGNEKADHLHFTYHPSIQKPRPVLRAAKGKLFQPRFNLAELTTLQEVVRHQLATPDAYPIRRPRPEVPDEKFHAVINAAYDGRCQPTVTFWVAPVSRDVNTIPDAHLVLGCFLYARTSPRSLHHDLLLQARLTHSSYTAEGYVHIMVAPIGELSA